MRKSIKLGKKLGDMLTITPMDKNEAHYPDLVLTDVTDRALAEMPDDGECVIKYHVYSRTHREEDGKPYSCTLRLDVKAITPPEKTRKIGSYGDDVRKSFKDNFKDR
jgi:hypothetical protein